jgi:VCBS repeat protein
MIDFYPTGGHADIIRAVRGFRSGFQGLAVLVLVDAGLALEPCARVEPGGPGDCNANGMPDECDLGPHALGFDWTSVHTVFRGDDSFDHFDIAPLDIDGDGDGDFVLHRHLRILAFLNRGDGTFEEPVESAGHQDSVYVVAGADVQGDGIPDLIVEDDFIFTSVEGVHFGRGDGTFGPFQEFHAPDPHSFLLAGDVDGDQRLDLVVGEYMVPVPAVTVLLGHPDSIFGDSRQSPVEGTPYGGELADLDDDGDLDLVLISGDFPHQGVALWTNDGTGRFAQSDGFSYAEPGVEIENVEVADLDGDGRPEIVFTVSSGTRFEVLIAVRDPGDPSRFLSPPAVTLRTPYLYGPLVLDFDDDGDQDLAMHDLGRLFIFENRSRAAGGAPAFDFAPPGESIASFREVFSGSPHVLEAGVRGADVLLARVRVEDCIDPVPEEIALLTPRREPRDRDCNENGVPDACDTDCNRDDIPDACQNIPSIRCPAPGGECPLDCNGNGVGDPCDIAEGASQDGNGDGIPDECQAAEAAFAFQGPINLRGEPGTEATADFACVLIPGPELLGVEPGVYS